MTPLQKLKAARCVRVHVTVANSPAGIAIWVSKSEIRRLIKNEGADPADAELWSWSELTADGTLNIRFAN